MRTKNQQSNQYAKAEQTLEDIVKDVDEVEELIGQATWKHILSRPHHPEFWDKKLSLDMPFDRANPKTNIDATEMRTEALVEYVCDCMAMSIQFQKDPKAVHTWFSDNIADKPGKRWIMLKPQLDFIHGAERATRLLFGLNRVCHIL